VDMGQPERPGQLRLDLCGGRRATCRSRVRAEGVAGIGLEYLEPSGGLRGAFDDPESCGGVEQPGPQNPGFLLVTPGVVAAVGQDDVDAVSGPCPPGRVWVPTRA